MITVIASLLLFALCNGLLVAVEFCLVRFRYRHTSPELYERLTRPYLIRWLVKDADRTARALRFGRVLTLLFWSGIFFFGTHVWWILWMHRFGTWTGSLLYLLLAVLAAGIFYVCAELVPRAIALRSPEKVLRGAGSITAVLLFLLQPLLFVIGQFKSRIYNLLQLNLDNDLSPLDIEVQLRAMGEKHTVLPPVARKIVDKAIQMPDLRVSDILLPRNQVQWIDLYDDPKENITMIRKTGHTRFPLCEGELDRCVGIIHIKDIFRKKGDPNLVDFRKIRRPIATLGLEDGLLDSLQKLLSLKMHMAVVNDDFGGMVGLITLEGILEELVGEIQDEFDMEDDEIVLIGENHYSIEGLAPLHETEETLGIIFEREDLSTFGGWVTAELGRIPENGEQFEMSGMSITITEVDEKRIIRMEVVVLPESHEEEEEEETKSKEEKSNT